MMTEQQIADLVRAALARIVSRQLPFEVQRRWVREARRLTYDDEAGITETGYWNLVHMLGDLETATNRREARRLIKEIRAESERARATRKRWVALLEKV